MLLCCIRCNAKALLGGNFNDYTPASAELYKKKGAWHTTPKKGDQIFFKNSQRICHTGIVYKVDTSRVYTIEGNASEKVCYRSYALTDSTIAGYGRPKYDVEEEKAQEEVKTSEGVKIDYAKKFWSAYAKSYKTTSDLNLRTGASTKKDVITVIPKGSKVTCYGYYSVNGSTTWLLVKFGKYTGFCSKKYLK